MCSLHGAGGKEIVLAKTLTLITCGNVEKEIREPGETPQVRQAHLRFTSSTGYLCAQ